MNVPNFMTPSKQLGWGEGGLIDHRNNYMQTGGEQIFTISSPLQKFPFWGGWRVINFWNTVKQFSWNMRETWPNFPLQIWQAAGKIFYPRPRDFFLFSFLEEGKMCGQKIPFFCDKYFFMLWVIPIKVSLQIHPL